MVKKITSKYQNNRSNSLGSWILGILLAIFIVGLVFGEFLLALISGSVFVISYVLLSISSLGSTNVEKYKRTNSECLKIIKVLLRSFLVGLFFLIVIVGLVFGKMDWLFMPSASQGATIPTRSQIGYVLVFPLLCVLLGAVLFELPLFYRKKKLMKKCPKHGTGIRSPTYISKEITTMLDPRIILPLFFLGVSLGAIIFKSTVIGTVFGGSFIVISIVFLSYHLQKGKMHKNVNDTQGKVPNSQGKRRKK